MEYAIVIYDTHNLNLREGHAMREIMLLFVVASLLVGCHEQKQKWEGPVEIALTDGSTITCRKSALISFGFTTRDSIIECSQENGLQMTIQWSQVVGLLRKDISASSETMQTGSK